MRSLPSCIAALSRIFPPTLAVLAIGWVAAAPRAALACSICGCDPSGGALGLERPAPGDLRLALEGRYLSKESGAGPSAEGETEGRSQLWVQYSPVPRLALSLEVPLYLWKNHFDPAGAKDSTARGLGDLEVGVRYEALRSGGFVPRHTLTLGAAIKAPTGNNNLLTPADAGIYDEHKQIGSGSTDGRIGAFYTYGAFPWVAYAGVQARFNGTNARGFHYGNALFGTLGARRTLLEARTLFVSLEAQARNAGYDSNGQGERDPDSGGFVGYATPSAGYQVRPDLLVRATLQVPVATALHGTQHEHLVGFLGLAWDVTM
jgi:hypothetical protein